MMVRDLSMRVHFLGALFFLLPVHWLPLLAQSYGNEWINFNQRYYKVKVASDGIHRIAYADLISAGLPVNSVDPRRMQLFHRGEELAIHIEGEHDARFDNTDYIEFYGQKNDGFLDATLYQPPEAQPHSYYNLFSDTTAYFLTWKLTASPGKRMTTFTEVNTGGLPPEPSHHQQNLMVISDRYSVGRTFNTYTQHTYFDYGEGWTGMAIQENEFVDYNVSGIADVVAGQGSPAIEVMLVGRDDLPHQAEIQVGPNFGSLRSIGLATFQDYNTYTFTSNVRLSDISGSGNLAVRVRALGPSGNDLLSVSYILVKYPQQLVMDSDQRHFRLQENSGGKSYVEIENPPVGATVYDISDPTDVYKIGYSSTGSKITAIVPGTATARDLFVNGTGFITPVVEAVSFEQIDPASYSYIIISHPLLRKPAGEYGDPVQAYADYRASAAGGSYVPYIADIGQLYDQFNFGEVSPRAIYEFMRFIVDNGNPQHLFLIGKGLRFDLRYHRRDPSELNFRDLVPTAGIPGADFAFTAGLDGTGYEPAVPTGRITVSTAAEVAAYLDKVKETEALTYDDLWRKRVLHLSGGIRESELDLFRAYMDGFKTIAEGKFLGGSVRTIGKQTDEVVELINVAAEVNEGVNLVTFFGHSAPAITDIDIGFATDPLMGYDNPGRYPFFLINGCNAGRFFNNSKLFGEDWITAENRGAIGFVAHTAYGFSTDLRDYTNTFYEVSYADEAYIGSTFGEIHAEVARRYIERFGTGPRRVTQAQQMLYLGDPALQIFGAKLPDFEISDNNIFIEPFDGNPVTALSDSFALKVIVRNFGRLDDQDLSVKLERTLSDNSVVTYDTTVAFPRTLDTLTLVIQNSGINGFGNNLFAVSIDDDDQVEELDETNNTGQLTFFVPLNGTRNLYPLNYAIVSSPTVNLMVQSTDLLEGSREYLIELDTTKFFNSPYKTQYLVSGELLVEQQVNLPGASTHDSTVYFWRSRFSQSQPNESDEWQVSSFIHINNGPQGWSQSVFRQLDENDLFGMEREEPMQKIEFRETATEVFIRTFGDAHPSSHLEESITLNGSEYNIRNSERCRNNTFNLIAFNKSTAIPYIGLPQFNGNRIACGRSPQLINSFRNTELETGDNDLFAFVDNIPEGDSVVLFNIGFLLYSSWSAALLQKLEELGIASADIAALGDGEPLIAYGRKGAPVGSARVITATTDPRDAQELQDNNTITGKFTSGTMESTLIGPAAAWEALRFNVEVSESPITDQYGLDVIGVTLEGTEQVLATEVKVSPFDLSFVDPSVYPWVRIRFTAQDEVNLSAPQVDLWQVLYESVPEGILLYAGGTNFERSEGDSLKVDFSFKNISPITFESDLSVRYSLFNTDTRVAHNFTTTITGPQVGESVDFSVAVSTVGLPGENNFTLNVNPNILPEQYYFNNVLSVPGFLSVIPDNINPILDVVFDGRYIQDGAIVSPSPLIGIQLVDENDFNLKGDTLGIDLFLKDSCDLCDFRRISFSSDEVNWIAAGEDNDFQVFYQPGPLEDGVYQLKVQARDATGNLSGLDPYAISFKVVNENTLTFLTPFPNPFRTNLKFPFLITGDVLLQSVFINITDLSGRVVRTIIAGNPDLFRSGENILSWDGADNQGDALPPGMYLYQFQVLTNGPASPLEGNSTRGKLYLMR